MNSPCAIYGSGLPCFCAESMKTIPLTQGYEAIVDDDVFPSLILHRWFADKKRDGNIYATRTVKSGERGYRGRNHIKMLPMHREVMSAEKGTLVDHIDRNGLNNQRSNLRIATHRENTYNKRSYSSTGIKGVYPIGKKWRVRICNRGKKECLGTFDNKLSAMQAYNKAALRLFGEFAYLNPISQL